MEEEEEGLWEEIAELQEARWHNNERGAHEEPEDEGGRGGERQRMPGGPAAKEVERREHVGAWEAPEIVASEIVL